jgi:phosphoserine phosphatase
MLTPVETESAAVVIARLEAKRRSDRGGVVAFDADGTLWKGDVGDDFFRRVLAEGRVEPAAATALRALADEFGVRAPDGPGGLAVSLDVAASGVALAAAIYEAYIRGTVPEDRTCEMVAFVCAGWTTNEVEELAARVVLQEKLSERMHGETVAVVDWARQAGVEAFVVSASPLAVVIEGARALGFDRDHIVAVTPREEGGTLSSEVERPIPYGEGKVKRLFERIATRPLYGAFGDNIFDIPLLRAAEVAVAVRPKPRLVERAGDVPGLVRMASSL